MTNSREGYEMTIMDLCVEAGRELDPCMYDPSASPLTHGAACECAGTGVMPDALTVLYELATDAADLAKREGLEEMAALLQYRARRDTGAGN